MGEKVISQDFDFFAYSAEETFGLLRLDQTLSRSARPASAYHDD